MKIKNRLNSLINVTTDWAVKRTTLKWTMMEVRPFSPYVSHQLLLQGVPLFMELLLPPEVTIHIDLQLVGGNAM